MQAKIRTHAKSYKGRRVDDTRGAVVGGVGGARKFCKSVYAHTSDGDGVENRRRLRRKCPRTALGARAADHRRAHARGACSDWSRRPSCPLGRPHQYLCALASPPPPVEPMMLRRWWWRGGGGGRRRRRRRLNETTPRAAFI